MRALLLELDVRVFIRLLALSPSRKRRHNDEKSQRIFQLIDLLAISLYPKQDRLSLPDCWDDFTGETTLIGNTNVSGGL